MKKMFKSLALVAALTMSATSFAATIEIDSDGTLEINVFANIIESFKVTITDADLVASGAAPASQGILDLNGGLAGYDALKSIAATTCKDDLNASPVFAGNSSCSIVVGPLSSASDSKLVFESSLDLAVEISGSAKVDLAVAMVGGATAFANTTVKFGTANAAAAIGLEDQDIETVEFHGEAPLNGGPLYDDTIVVTVTKQ